MSAGRGDDVLKTRMAHTAAIEAAFNHLHKEADYARDGVRYLDATLRLYALDHIASERDAGDPHLHTHLIVELTATDSGGRELPVDRRGLDAVRPAIHAVYDATLAVQLEDTMSIAMVRRAGADRREVAGIEDEHIRAFRGSRCVLGLEQMVVTG
jgi:TrwC relaxase